MILEFHDKVLQDLERINRVLIFFFSQALVRLYICLVVEIEKKSNAFLTFRYFNLFSSQV